METIFLGYLGYNLKNIPKTFHLELFLYQRYIQNSNFIILSRTNCEGIILSIFLQLNLKIGIQSLFSVTSKTIIQKSPYFRGVALWNALPVDLQHVKTLSKFKNLIKLDRM